MSICENTNYYARVTQESRISGCCYASSKRNIYFNGNGTPCYARVNNIRSFVMRYYVYTQNTY